MKHPTTKSIYLIDYTGPNLETHINNMCAGRRVVQILPVSEFRSDGRTGMTHRDYLLVYKVNA